MRRWRTTRIKLAGKITKIDGYILHIEGHNTSIEVDIGYLRKHRPQVGWYYIMYEDDGYQSACPADVFERSHTETHSNAMQAGLEVEAQAVEDENLLTRDHVAERKALGGTTNNED